MSDSAQTAGESNGANGHEHPDRDSPGTNPDGSTLDTTLLESLFYNEMMMLDDSAEFLSTITAGVETHSYEYTAGTSTPEKRETRKGQADPLTVAEQSLLRDFGVSGSGSPVPATTSGDAPKSEAYSPSSGQQQVSQQSDPNQNVGQQSHPHQPSWNQQYYQHPSQDQNHNPYQNPHYQHPYQPPPNHQYYDTQNPPPYYAPPSHQHSYPPQPPPGQSHAPPPPPPPHQPQQISRGIKHSVAPKYEPPRHDQSAQSSSSITNPLAQQHQYPSQPHQQHPHPPQHPPQPHQQYPLPPHQQHYYHGSHPPPTQPYQHHQYPPNTPNLVPVPAPAPPQQPGSYHEQSAFGPPVSAPPPSHYSSEPPAIPVASHPAPVGHPHSHSSTQPPKQQLVSQFATLASRLGINLPPNLLDSLTESAGAVSGNFEDNGNKSNGMEHPKLSDSQGTSPQKNDTNTPQHGTGDADNAEEQPGQQESQEAPVSRPTSVASSTSSGAMLDSTPPALNAVRKTAEDAIAAITRKRSSDEAKATSGDGSDSNSNKPSYAKRRKKPRLSDCESRLEKLREENELLKQHLDNVTNQSQRFEQERVKSEEAMKRMMEAEEVTDDELNEVIRDYTEMYADYGKRRHQELSFHLEQLQKLANPTNFTKMGLWTIAKANRSKDASKQNPLIGILQKELSITPQQTRKILDQRAKIRDLCSNLNASLVLLQKLKDLCEQKNKTFNDRINKTREILTPKQVVKLIMFVKVYSDVLGTVCPGWTSEQIVQKKRIPATSNTTKAQAELSKETATNPSEAAPVQASRHELPSYSDTHEK